MPKFVRARPPLDDGEARKIRTLAGARHAPAGWTGRAQIIALSRDGMTVPAIAAETGCHPNRVRRWLHRFSATASTGPATAPAPGANGGSPGRSGHASSRWPARCRPGG